MPTYKIQIQENGAIEGCQEIFAENDAFWVDGIEVEKWFYDLVASDLMAAINTYRFDFQTETFVPRPEITAIPDQSPDQFILTGLPTTHPDTGSLLICTVTVKDAGTYEVDDGEFGFPLTLSGTYKVKVEAFPYITKEWEVIVP